MITVDYEIFGKIKKIDICRDVDQLSAVILNLKYMSTVILNFDQL